VIRLKEGITTQRIEDVAIFIAPDELTNSERKEIHFWSTDPSERPEADFYASLRIKAGDLRAFETLIACLDVGSGGVCLEVGAGQAWASALLKRMVPGAEVHASDVSADALRGTTRWEELLKCRLDGKWAFRSANSPFAEGVFDRIFTYAAFHHFGVDHDFSGPLRELLRILRPGGQMVFLMEPCTPAALYRYSHSKINRVRKVVLEADIDEDVLVVSDLKRQVQRLGGTFRHEFETTWAFREMGLAGVVRNALVRLVPLFGRLVPCAANLTIRKPSLD
jgi:SAM-dependent methyltransferase